MTRPTWGRAPGAGSMIWQWPPAYSREKKVHPGTRLVVVPASKGVYLESMARGDVETLVRAGAVMATPGCAACLGTHLGLLARDEVCISSTNRNFSRPDGAYRRQDLPRFTGFGGRRRPGRPNSEPGRLSDRNRNRGYHGQCTDRACFCLRRQSGYRPDLSGPVSWN